MGKIIGAFELFKSFYAEYLFAGVIMVSAIIVFIGLLKPIFYDKILCKPLRKSLLALSSVILSFVSTAVVFLVNYIYWDYYIHASIAVSVLTIITYFLYEHTHLRTLIHTVGTIVLKKIANIFFKIFNGEDKAQIDKEIESIKSESKKAITATKIDNDLKKL